MLKDQALWHTKGAAPEDDIGKSLVRTIIFSSATLGVNCLIKNLNYCRFLPLPFAPYVNR